ncbi:MAG TPA: hypothetical protein VF178_14690 [Gemmatimonadaceae bacterium]
MPHARELVHDQLTVSMEVADLNVMPRTWWRPLAPAMALVVALAACRDDPPARGNDTAATGAPPPAVPEPPTAAPITWDTSAGLFFALVGESPSSATLIDARYGSGDQLDTLRPGPGIDALEFELFAGGDSAGVARIVSIAGVTAAQCAGWPRVQVAAVSPETPVRAWRVAFPRGRVTALPWDSLPRLSAADSARLTVAIARAASRVEGDTAAAFRGRPFVVRQANRVGADHRFVFAEVVRTVQQEANPLQEQMLLVLEQTDEEREGFRTVYHQRAITLEEHLESVELIAALRINATGVPALLLRRDSEQGTAFVLLERGADGTWYQRWRSPPATC